MKMIFGKKWTPWSAADDKLLLELCAGRATMNGHWGEVSEKFDGRSPVACRQRYLNLRKQAAGEEPRLRVKEHRTNSRMFRDAAIQRRPQNLEHASLTAEFFGDPLPGRSALDQIKQQEPNRAQFDRRFSDFRPAITLATEPVR